MSPKNGNWDLQHGLVLTKNPTMPRTDAAIPSNVPTVRKPSPVFAILHSTLVSTSRQLSVADLSPFTL